MKGFRDFLMRGNLVELAVLGLTAERALGAARWWCVWLVAGVGAQFWGFVVQPEGGGNSVATFGLAAALAVRALLRGGRPARLLGAVSLLAGLVLLAVRDVHGGGVVLGAITGLVLTGLARSAGPLAAAPGEQQAARQP